MACRSFSFPLMGEAEISESLDGSLSIDIYCPVLLLRLRFFQSQSRSRHWDLYFSVSVSALRLDIFSLSLVIETRIFSVSVSSLRLRHFQSQSRHWDSDLSKYCQIIEQILYIVLSVIKDMDNWPNIVCIVNAHIFWNTVQIMCILFKYYQNIEEIYHLFHLWSKILKIGSN